jgi:hypothetical protein
LISCSNVAIRPQSRQILEGLGSAPATATERLDVGPGETLLPEQFPDSSLILTEEIALSCSINCTCRKQRSSSHGDWSSSGKRISRNFWMSLSSLSGIPISIGCAAVIPTPAMIATLDPLRPDVLLNDVRTLITQAERQTTTDANIESTLLYWHIGKRTAGEIPGSERVAYGEQIVDTFSRPLVARYDLGDIERNLWPMIQFVEYLPEEDLVAAG